MHQGTSSVGKVTGLLETMRSSPGMVASTYLRLLQDLTDVYCSFFHISAGPSHSAAELKTTLNNEIGRFLADCCTSTKCPEAARTCFLEAQNSFVGSSSAGAYSPTFSEELVSHVLYMLVLEFAPPFTGTLEITFNKAARLEAGMTFATLLTNIRQAASEGSIPEHSVKSRILAVVQEASSHPDVNRNVLDTVLARVTEMMSSGSSVHALCAAVQSGSCIGGYLGDPIIPVKAAEPPPLALPPPAHQPQTYPLVSAGGFHTTASGGPIVLYSANGGGSPGGSHQ